MFRVAKKRLGEKFGRLTVVGHAFRLPKRNWYAVCQCECGTFKAIRLTHLIDGTTQSCRCLAKENTSKRTQTEEHRQYNVTHGGTVNGKTKLFHVWCTMRARCRNPKLKDYRWYGAKGIRVCRQWMDFARFRDWALANGYEEGLSIDRIDADGNYEPSNCRWITLAENIARSKRRMKK